MVTRVHEMGKLLGSSCHKMGSRTTVPHPRSHKSDTEHNPNFQNYNRSKVESITCILLICRTEKNESNFSTLTEVHKMGNFNPFLCFLYIRMRQNGLKYPILWTSVNLRRNKYSVFLLLLTGVHKMGQLNPFCLILIYRRHKNGLKCPISWTPLTIQVKTFSNNFNPLFST